MSSATSRGDGIRQEVTLDSGHTINYDEPTDKGGKDTCLNPTESLAAALAGCTASTMRLYAARKDWDLTGLEVTVDTEYERYTPSSFKVRIEFPEGLDPDQVERLTTIAGKCPVHQALAGSVPIEIH